jgi:myo-inositol-1(or 4)-monophosphatase
MNHSWRAELAFATETAWHAGQLTLGYFQTGLRPDRKADESPVTIADREAEEYIRERIATAYPNDGLLGEEFGASGSTQRRWIIDPIDGTRTYVRGVPLYAVLIALEVDGEIPVGVAYYPALGEMLAAARGAGCWWNGRPARVSTTADLDQALIAFTDAATFGPYGRDAAWVRFRDSGATVRGWSDAYGYLLVATGRAEVMLDPIMSVWDCAPFLPILQEAGGYFGDWDGNPTIRGGEAMACNEALLPQVLSLIRGD